METELNVLVVKPGQMPQQEIIRCTRSVIREIIGGDMTVIHPWADRWVDLICCSDGGHRGFPFNRFLEEQDVGAVCGPFVLCRLVNDKLKRLFDEDIPFLMERFSMEERVAKSSDGRILVLRRKLSSIRHRIIF